MRIYVPGRYAEGRRGRRSWEPDDPWAYGVYALFIVGACVFFLLPGLLVERHDFVNPADWYKARSDVRTAGIQLVGGFVLVVGSYFTARTLRLNRQGHITDRFSRAVEHVGGDSQATRLGGIYALERIMQDAPSEQGPILEILTAFVRAEGREPGRERSPPAELAAALKVLGRRDARQDPDGFRLNLSQADLSFCSLRDGDFARTNFFKTDLRGTYLVGTVLIDALLEDADLRDATVRGVDFSGVTISPGTKWPEGLDPPPRSGRG